MSKSNIDHQNKQLQNNVSGKGILAEFDCPCCRVKQQIPQIQNLGEEKTQVKCVYGCGYLFLEDFASLKDREYEELAHRGFYGSNL